MAMQSFEFGDSPFPLSVGWPARRWPQSSPDRGDSSSRGDATGGSAQLHAAASKTRAGRSRRPCRNLPGLPAREPVPRKSGSHSVDRCQIHSGQCELENGSSDGEIRNCPQRSKVQAACPGLIVQRIVQPESAKAVVFTVLGTCDRS